jgi:hypothetical protein
VLFWTDAGKVLLLGILKPIQIIGQPVFEVILPYFLKSPYNMGIG